MDSIFNTVLDKIYRIDRGVFHPEVQNHNNDLNKNIHVCVCLPAPLNHSASEPARSIRC